MSDETDLILSAPQQRFLPSEAETGRVWNLAHRIANTEFVPRDLRGKPEAILAAMLTGREIGIGPMHSLRGIDVIDGRPSLSAELMASLVFRAGHTMWVVESTNEVCIMAGRRSDWPDRVPDHDQAWSMEDANQAGLSAKSNWKKYPRAMLRARATSELCRAIFPDVVERVGYVAEELGSERDPDHVAQVEIVRERDGDEAAEVIEGAYADEHEQPPETSVSPDVGDGEASPSGEEGDGWDVDPPTKPADTGPYNWREAGRAKVQTALKEMWGWFLEDVESEDAKRSAPVRESDLDEMATKYPQRVAEAVRMWTDGGGEA